MIHLPLPDTRRDYFLAEAMSHQGKPYIWGANGPDTFDCSGLVVWCGILAGLWPEGWDGTTKTIYQDGLNKGWDAQDALSAGTLIFWSWSDSPENIHHIGIALTDGMVLEAGGGNSHTTNVEVAEKVGANVRIRYGGSITERLSRGRNKRHSFYLMPFSS